MHYKAVFHVDQKEEQVFNLAVNNVINLLNAIPEQEYDLIVLLNGPAVGLMTREAVVSFLERIQGLVAQGVRFQVCDNALKRFEVSRKSLIPECQIIPAGIVGLIDLQHHGFAYIKP